MFYMHSTNRLQVSIFTYQSIMTYILLLNKCNHNQPEEASVSMSLCTIFPCSERVAAEKKIKVLNYLRLKLPYPAISNSLAEHFYSFL